MVSLVKLRNRVPFYDTGDRRVHDDRQAAVFYAFGREDGGDVLPTGGAPFVFADEYARARARYAVTHGLVGAFEEFMRTGWVDRQPRVSLRKVAA